jgi:signal transducing adaptor molecule
MRDKGGRSTYAPAPAPSAGSSGASKYASGYVRAQSPPSPKKQAQAQAHTPTSHNGHGGGYPATSGGVSTKAASSTTSLPSQVPVVTRVRALHAFEPTEPGELAFEKGDVIKVVDRGYKDWWRGQLKGRTGIFPVNYVVRRSSHLPNHNDGSQVA